MNNWPLAFSKRAIIYSIVVPIIISLLYPSFFIPVGLYTIGIIIVAFFFLGLSHFTKSWSTLPYRVFEAKLFRYSFLFRFIYVFYLYALVYVIDPLSFPFELNAADSWVYHNAAVVLSKTSFSDFFNVLPDLMKSRSDYGYPIYQGIIYSIFGPYTLPVRLINCFLGSYTVVLLSRITHHIFTEKHARIAGIIAMLFPSLLWFGAIQLKETLMLFITVLAFYQAIDLHSKNRLSLKSLIVIVLSVTFLFYFRTFHAVLVMLSIIIYFSLNWVRNLSVKKLVIIVTISSSVVVVMNSIGLFSDVEAQYNDKENIFTRNLQGEVNLLRNISFKEAAVAPLVIIGSFITPFPSFLDTEKRQMPIIARFQNEMVRNLLYYFAILGVIICFKKSFKKTSILLFFIFSYLYVITAAANSFQDRFHLPMVPFIIIMMSVGIVESKVKWIHRWNWYIVFIFVAHISWSIFKLIIRGL